MYVQSLPSGPSAISAVEFAVPPGATVGVLTLTITGTPLVTAPPVVCLLTSPFTSAEGGPWKDRPSYDCTHQVAGIVNAGKTQVTFAVTGLVNASDLRLAVLAGGSADRIAFAKPGADALTVTAPSQSLSVAPAPQPSTTAAFAAPVPAAPDALAVLPPPAAAESPPASSPTVAPAPTAPPAGQATPAASASASPSPVRRTLGTTLGVVLLLLLIIYWADGFGAVPLRTAVSRRWPRMKETL